MNGGKARGVPPRMSGTISRNVQMFHHGRKTSNYNKVKIMNRA